MATRILGSPRTTEGAPHPQNEGTAMYVLRRGRPPPFVAVDPEREHAAWQELLDRVQQWRAERMDEHALAVVVRSPPVDAASGPVLGLAVASSREGPAACIVGRHTQCDAHLSDGLSSLRHAAVLLWPSASPAVRTRAIAIDLASSAGLQTRRGSARRIASETALHFRAGLSDVYALAAARDAPFAVRWRDELEAHVQGALVDPEERPLPPARPEEWERSVVVRTGRALLQEQMRPDTIVVRAHADQLARGVVLGRDARCRRTNEIEETHDVSRVHALAFAADGALWLVDTASTHGTRIRSDEGDVRLGEGRRIAPIPASARVFLARSELGLDLMR